MKPPAKSCLHPGTSVIRSRDPLRQSRLLDQEEGSCSLWQNPSLAILIFFYVLSPLSLVCMQYAKILRGSMIILLAIGILASFSCIIPLPVFLQPLAVLTSICSNANNMFIEHEKQQKRDWECHGTVGNWSSRTGIGEGVSNERQAVTETARRKAGLNFTKKESLLEHNMN